MTGKWELRVLEVLMADEIRISSGALAVMIVSDVKHESARRLVIKALDRLIPATVIAEPNVNGYLYRHVSTPATASIVQLKNGRPCKPVTK